METPDNRAETGGDPTAERPAGNWAPDSWRSRVAEQQPVYDDEDAVQSVIERLAQLPPLVNSWEVENLKHRLAEAAAGRAFLLQGGDCSERIEDCQSDAIVRNLKVMFQMSFVITYESTKRVVRVGRTAGQYAKPRSQDTETRDGITLPSYRGDIVNRSGFTAADRQPDPELMLTCYERAALTLNFIRSLIGGGFADLHHPEHWELDFAVESTRAKKFRRLVDSIAGSLRFMESTLDGPVAQTNILDFFTSHEGLHLPYEQAQTRQVPRRDGWYNLSTHFPWLGYRTQSLSGAHIEYFRGIQNPVGVKVGPAAQPQGLIDLIRVLNPENEPGRITLIHRLGANAIENILPGLIQAVERSKLCVLWCSDPMHGNTFQTDDGVRTRRFDQIVDELRSAFQIHRRLGSILGGVHLELTGDNVTECVGGWRNLTESDLGRAYKSAIDPRLNYEQAMEIASLVAEEVKLNAG